MALDATNADAVATAFCAANGITDAAAIAKWKSLMEYIYFSSSGSLVHAITATLPTNSVVTVGSPSTQTGPTSPVSVTIS